MRSPLIVVVADCSLPCAVVPSSTSFIPISGWVDRRDLLPEQNSTQPIRSTSMVTGSRHPRCNHHHRGRCAFLSYVYAHRLIFPDTRRAHTPSERAFRHTTPHKSTDTLPTLPRCYTTRTPLYAPCDKIWCDKILMPRTQQRRRQTHGVAFYHEVCSHRSLFPL